MLRDKLDVFVARITVALSSLFSNEVVAVDVILASKMKNARAPGTKRAVRAELQSVRKNCFS